MLDDFLWYFQCFGLPKSYPYNKNVESAASNDAVLRENERLKEEILKRDHIIAERNRIIEELQARLRYLQQPC
ncbi:hypothetical protein AB6A40_000679 [Gnathostoma spinigerum]|uniref:Uncharacterized protein n=1 Tax=Gnathostoma spinigerum TaxID=75299 RepID=A0ABD6E2J3_9BILA